MKLTPSLKMALASMPPEIQKEFTRDLTKRSKSLGTAYLAWLFLGWHYLYMGRVGMQFAFWFTGGFLVVGWFIDFFRLPGMVARINEDMALELIGQYKMMHSATPQAVQTMIAPTVESPQKSGFLPLLVRGFLLFCLIGLVIVRFTKNTESKSTIAPESKEAPTTQNTAHATAKTKTAAVSLSVQAIAADRSLWPKSVSLNENVSVPVNTAGNMTLPAGSSLQLVSVGADGMLEILWNSIRAKVPADKTNIIEVAAKIQTSVAELKAAENARRAAEDAKPKPSQKEANAFVGITEQELIGRLGQPLRVANETRSDGRFKVLTYSDTQEKGTFFAIFSSNGLVDNGIYRGVPLSKFSVEQEKDEALVGKKPINSPFDGSVRAVKEYMETTLKDPKSTEYIEWGQIKMMDLKDGKAWAVYVKYRSKNSFGGYVIDEGIAFIRRDECVGYKSLVK